MRVISTTDLSREGNDCYIYESISLVEQFGLYSIISILKVVGWSEYEGTSVIKYTTDYEAAKKAYVDNDGVLTE